MTDIEKRTHQNTGKKKTAAARKPSVKTAEKKAEQVTEPIVMKETAPVSAPETGKENAEVEMLKAQLAAQSEILKQLQAQLANSRPQVVQVMADTEKIVLRWQAEVADENILDLGPSGVYGSITGKTGYASIPKSEWSKFLTGTMKRLIRDRMLIVISGMTDEEREMNGCLYREGELLDEKAFAKLLDTGDDLIAVFPKLCHQHKEMVARRFIEGYDQGRAVARRRDLVVALNEISKEDKAFPPRGAFYSIIEKMNAKDAE